MLRLLQLLVVTRRYQRRFNLSDWVQDMVVAPLAGAGVLAGLRDDLLNISHTLPLYAVQSDYFVGLRS